jgi:methionine-gamma-lyase
VDHPAPKDGRPGISTRAIHDPVASGPTPLGHPLAPPIYQTSTFEFSTPEEMMAVFAGTLPGYVYSRYDNPTVAAVERKLCRLEDGARALLFSSGVAAIHAAFWSTLAPGDRLLAGRDLYGGTVEMLAHILPRQGIEIERVDLGDHGATMDALDRRPRAVYLESPTNPRIRVLDVPSIVEHARAVGVLVIVDNTFATPVLQNPIVWGADLVVHSATKYLGGHSDIVLGAAVTAPTVDADRIEDARRRFGSTPDPFAAWLLNRGLMTLSIRIHAQTASAGLLARRLSEHPKVRHVDYPGLTDDPGHMLATRIMRGYGGMLAFELRGGLEAAREFMSGLRLIRLASSLGGPESLISHPATSSHAMISAPEREALGIGDGLLRLSVGLEDVEDLAADLVTALAGVGRGGR